MPAWELWPKPCHPAPGSRTYIGWDDDADDPNPQPEPSNGTYIDWDDDDYNIAKVLPASHFNSSRIVPLQ